MKKLEGLKHIPFWNVYMTIQFTVIAYHNFYGGI